jgi:predicted NAD/FAD-binding protein
MSAHDTGRMDIGIIGGGASGLTTAWLLSEHHNVTVLEKQNRLGGHAQTVNVNLDGRTVTIDAGFDFFTQTLWPTFYKLLHTLHVPLHKYPGTMTLYTKDNHQIYSMPLIRNGGIEWSLFRPDALSKMLHFNFALKHARPIIEARDTSVTLGQFTKDLNLGDAFISEFCDPMFMAIWGVDMHDYRSFAAYNALKYYVLCEAGRFTQFYFTEVVGGSQVYIEALLKAQPKSTIKTSVAIRRITRPSVRFVVEADTGARYEFDHLIVATNACDARGLISQIPETEEIRRELGAIEYFKGTTAVHGDQRLMPRNRRDWSVFNIRNDGTHSSLTVWKKWKSATPVFKSWVTFEPHLPEPLYFVETYDHPKVTPAYFAAQRRIAPLQGRNNLWLAGLYTGDIDSHESAIQSAVRIARHLDPESSNLRLLN